MIFNYSKLRGRIREKFGTEGAFASAMGISTVSLSGRLNNKLSFEQPEMIKAGKLLDIPIEELAFYFFERDLKKFNLSE